MFVLWLMEHLWFDLYHDDTNKISLKEHVNVMQLSLPSMNFKLETVNGQSV